MAFENISLDFDRPGEILVHINDDYCTYIEPSKPAEKAKLLVLGWTYTTGNPNHWSFAYLTAQLTSTSKDDREHAKNTVRKCVADGKKIEAWVRTEYDKRTHESLNQIEAALRT